MDYSKFRRLENIEIRPHQDMTPEHFLKMISAAQDQAPVLADMDALPFPSGRPSGLAVQAGYGDIGRHLGRKLLMGIKR